MPSREASSTRSPSEQLRPTAVKTRAGWRTGGIPTCVLTMHGRTALEASMDMSVAELRPGFGVGGAAASTGTGPGTSGLSCVAVALVERRGMLWYSSVRFPVPTLFLAAPLALDRMIKVAGTESYTIAQTLEPPLLFQRLFPADWSTILL